MILEVGRTDFVLDLLEAGSLAAVLQLDDMKTVLAPNNIAHLAWLERKGRILELLDHLAALEPAEVPALGGCPLVLGVLLGQLGEVRSPVQLPLDLLDP